MGLNRLCKICTQMTLRSEELFLNYFKKYINFVANKIMFRVLLEFYS